MAQLKYSSLTVLELELYPLWDLTTLSSITVTGIVTLMPRKKKYGIRTVVFIINKLITEITLLNSDGKC